MNNYVVDCNVLRKNDRIRSEVDVFVVLESEFDTVASARYQAETALSAAQVELAALREELATAKRHEYNTQVRMSEEHVKLTAAKQRNAEGLAAMQLATKLLDKTLSSLNPRNSLAYEVRHFLAAHRKNKPAESGASE